MSEILRGTDLPAGFLRSSMTLLESDRARLGISGKARKWIPAEVLNRQSSSIVRRLRNVVGASEFGNDRIKEEVK